VFGLGKKAVLRTQGCGRECRTSTSSTSTVSSKLDKRALLRTIFVSHLKGRHS